MEQHKNTRIPPLIDTHAHLQLEPLIRDPEGVVHRAEFAGLISIITIGIDLEDARLGVKIADRFEQVFASVGIHPHHAETASDHALEKMMELASHPKVKAYGEIGLDFFRNRAPRDSQRAAFTGQLEMAKKLELPVIIHLRDAYDEGLDLLERAAPFQARGVIHCFSGGKEEADRALDLGFCISVPGNITYKKNDELRAVIRSVPVGRLLLETDCPFLTPEPIRKRSNEPAFMVHTAKRVAEIRDMTIEELAGITTKNAVELFRL